MEVFTCKDVLYQIMLAIDTKDLKNLAQVNKLSAAIPRLDYFWESRYKRDHGNPSGGESNDYRAIYKYKSIYSNTKKEIYNVIFYHQSVHNDPLAKFFTLKIKTSKKSEIYNYISHLYNHEDFPEKQFIKMSIVRGIRKVNEQRFTENDKKILSDLSDLYYKENTDEINNVFYGGGVICESRRIKMKDSLTCVAREFYGTNNLSLAGYSSEQYNRFILKFFDFLAFHHFRLDLNPVAPHMLTPVTITPDLIKHVIKNSQGCIILNKENLIEL